jgi:DNA polymerase-3 subunit gamma/tau
MQDYKALARQWRPQSFQYFVGQQHAITALQQSLKRKSVHHAHLLTGTRGVGKTSLARVLAKGLSCIKGVTDVPCEQCEHCKAIEQGNYVDLIEIDAASKTKVEDTKELLNQVHYPPVQGRYKIYLIDEVHSLSANSFNALLKTLEEPPEHIKFILATTDPQKLPITIQSRCIQLHLQQLTEAEIAKQLEKILTDRSTTFSHQAMMTLAEAANGSMRDAISLLEQAIALCKESIDDELINNMLGRAPKADIKSLVHSIHNNAKEKISEHLGKIEKNQLNYHTVIDQMITYLYQVTQQQVLSTGNEANKTDADNKRFGEEQVQLYIQQLIKAKGELDLYPDQPMGFNLTVLRMMAFKLEQTSLAELIKQQPLPIMQETHETLPRQSNTKNESTVATIINGASKEAIVNHPTQETTTAHKSNNNPKVPTQTTREVTQPTNSQVYTSANNHEDHWNQLKNSNECRGMISQILATAIAPNNLDDNNWEIRIDSSLSNLATPTFEQKIEAICLKTLKRTIKISLTCANTDQAKEKPIGPGDNHTKKEKSTITKKAETHNKKLDHFINALEAEPLE